MEKSDKQELLDAFAALTAHVDGRIDGLEHRIGGMAEDLAEFKAEVRSGFARVDERLSSLEETVGGIAHSLDQILEGDVLGKEHITLTRPEYDSLMDVAHLPNRFAS